MNLAVAPQLEPLHVQADLERTGQVLANLVADALRHAPPGGAAHLSASRLAGTQVEFGVRDTGDGVPPQALPHVFARFYRADEAREYRRGESARPR